MIEGPNYLNRKDGDTPSPDYLDRKTGVNWKQHEQDVAKRSGGQRRSASGSAPGKPADTKDDVFLRECKSTAGAGLSVSGRWLAKIAAEALSLGKIPLMELRLDGQEAPTPKDWVMIPSIDFEAILERIAEGNNE